MKQYGVTYAERNIYSILLDLLSTSSPVSLAPGPAIVQGWLARDIMAYSVLNLVRAGAQRSLSQS